MFFNVTNAEYSCDYIIRLEFRNGRSGSVDLKNYIENEEIFRGILPIEKFKSFAVEFGTITWENGVIDIAPEKLYEMTTGEKIRFDLDPVKKAV